MTMMKLLSKCYKLNNLINAICSIWLQLYYILKNHFKIVQIFCSITGDSLRETSLFNNTKYMKLEIYLFMQSRLLPTFIYSFKF